MRQPLLRCFRLRKHSLPVQQIQQIVQLVLKRFVAFAPALVGLAHHILRLAGIQLRELFAQLLRKRQKRFTGKGLQFRFLRVCGKGMICAICFILSDCSIR